MVADQASDDDPCGSLGDVLRLLAPEMGHLVGGEALMRAIAAADHVPVLVSRYFILEVRPTADVADLEVQLRWGPDDRGAEAYSALGGTGRRRAGVSLLVSILNDPADIHHHLCRDSWLEYDLDSWHPPGPLPGPSVFFGARSRESIASDPMAGPRLAARLTGWGVTQGPLAAMARLCGSVAPSARVQQHGILLGRPGRGGRLCLAADDPGQVLDALHRNGWRGDRDQVLAAVTDIADAAHWWMLDVDLTETGIGDRIGVELGVYPTRDSGPARRLARAVADSGFAPPEWCARAGACRSAFWVPPTATSESLLAVAGMSSGTVPGTRPGLMMGLSHLKITFSPGQPAATKAYIGFRAAAWRPTEAPEVSLGRSIM